MDLNKQAGSPTEERELEDGEICDDETEERTPIRRGDGNRHARGAPTTRTRKSRHPHNMLPHLGHQPPPDFRVHLLYNRHGPFPPILRQQCRPNGPEMPPVPTPPPPLLPPPVPPGLGPHGEPSPRTSFWERSHGALGRFRHRAITNGGRGYWNRGRRGGGDVRGPPGRYGPAESYNKKDSPSRKQKLPGRNQPRRALKPESVDETFEDLLSKYKQIQLELECIRKEETMALEPKGSPAREQSPADHVSAETKPVPEPAPHLEEPSELEAAEKKVFQAFNIKPLRQKLPTVVKLDELKKKWAEQENGGEGEKEGEEEEDTTSPDGDEELKEKITCPSLGADADKEEEEKKTACQSGSSASSEESVLLVASDKRPLVKVKEKKTGPSIGAEKGKGEKKSKKRSRRSGSSASSEESLLFISSDKVEEEEMSELQLRLLALQSASKKWQQKEQQVMRRSKERICKAVQEKSSASAAAPPGRQRVTTRAAAAAAAAAANADRNRTRSRAQERDRDRTKTAHRPPERERPKPSPKPGPKAAQERSRTQGKAAAAKKNLGQGSAAKQAFRKQQLRTWKLQQQREQEEKRRQEEEERRKREDEIRRIRDLSNQDEQYNRFMKLVGGKTRTRSRSTDREHRKSAGKQSLDSSGNLYQYDNYDEVAMDTDSEPGSPVPSPTREQLTEGPGYFPPPSLYVSDPHRCAMDFAPPFLSAALSGVPPPPPPLPPPPDEPEPPPKPPFADEEEEEEMLLRETCLMSMANKRVPAAEERSCSGPPSPSCLPPAGAEQPTRGNLSAVSLNTVTQSRTNKFPRGHHRTPLVLPRHKSVVVSLNDSDDSDSDPEAAGTARAAFGGLEFMIKEARRTVEASRPKAASGSEKENNPVRTPEALPEAKKAEYRLLKEEIASREKQKMLKDPVVISGLPVVPDPVLDSSGKSAAKIRLMESQQRLSKHRELLQRDEAILRQLLQQELKKKESLKAAETKVAKLREQLQASEKIVGANKTLLKKLQEQVQRVEHRVSIKRSLADRMEQEVTQVQMMAARGSKRKTESNQLLRTKLQRLDRAPRGSEHHFAALIAQKQRLQQLESEYALKILKLKEAQALRNKVPPLELTAEPPVRAAAPPEPQNQTSPPSTEFPLPQPSLHDLTQDKLAFDSEDVPEAEDRDSEATPTPTPQPAAAAVGGTRRHSFRQSSSSFTKPNLEQPGSAPAKDTCSSKPTKSSPNSRPPEMFAGLDVEALRTRYRQQARLGELLLTELHKVLEHVVNPPAGQVVSTETDAATTRSGSAELKPVPFEPYHSPLLVFRSYRFSPYYRTKEKLSLSSVTYSNTIKPKVCFCRFDLSGTCNDDDCRWQHMRNCTLTGNQLFQDILSYDPPLIGCSEISSDEDVSEATEKYMKKLFGPNKDRMGSDQKAVLLVSKVNESKRHVPPFTTCKDPRRWRPKPSAQSCCGPKEDGEEEAAAGAVAAGRHDDVSRSSLSAPDVCVTSEDKRYFVSETDDISNLETSVLESPGDTQLWIKLAFKYLNQNQSSAAECLEAALNTLSRALETNCEDPEVWSHYLSLFSKRGSKEEVQEMCEMAVEHAPNYQVWWTYLNLETSFEGKEYVCDRLLHFLLAEASSEVSEKLSFHLVETLLYRVDLNLVTGRIEGALAVLQNALKSPNDRSIGDHVTASDRVLLWLSYIHLTEFDRLPSSLFDSSKSGPSRLVNRESFLLPWRTRRDISTPPDILIALFQDAIHQCGDESTSRRQTIMSCLPLHTNLIFLHRVLERFDDGVALCESLLDICPESCALRDALAELHMGRGDGGRAVSMWLHALAECPNNAEVFYHSCKFLMAQEKSSAIVPLFRGFILSLCEDQQSEKQPVDVLRYILGFPTDGVLRGPIIKEVQEQLNQQMPYLHLIHCRWQWLHGSPDETAAAFERALGSSLQLEELHKLWMDYLLFSSSQRAAGQTKTRSKLFPDLVQRCLSTIPSRLEVPFNPAEFWSCYRFHNQVVAFFLSCLPPSQHALVLERLRYAMPNNTELGLRLLHQEWREGNVEHLKFQVRMLSSSSTKCLSFWKIAIAVEMELKEPSEVRLLYQQALHHLPLSAALWKDRLLFEAAEGGQADRLARLLERCQQVGVSLSE